MLVWLAIEKTAVSGETTVCVPRSFDCVHLTCLFAFPVCRYQLPVCSHSKQIACIHRMDPPRKNTGIGQPQQQEQQQHQEQQQQIISLNDAPMVRSQTQTHTYTYTHAWQLSAHKVASVYCTRYIHDTQVITNVRPIKPQTPSLPQAPKPSPPAKPPVVTGAEMGHPPELLKKVRMSIHCLAFHTYFAFCALCGSVPRYFTPEKSSMEQVVVHPSRFGTGHLSMKV